MSSSAGVLDFFIIEASEYVERLDGLVASSGARGPDAMAFARNSRMLRGSATMSRCDGIAAVARGLESVARAMSSGQLAWEPGLAAAITGSVDDLRILLRNVRTWAAADDKRSAARTAELARFAPNDSAPTTAPPKQRDVFLAGETSELATVLDRFAAVPTAEALAKALQRLRALRGVADVRDIAPVGEVIEATEDALKAMETSAGSAATDAQRALARAAAAFLRRASRDIGVRGRPDPDSAELAEFHGAASMLPQQLGKGDRIVPISQLFHDDAGPHIVSTGAHPPTTAPERFRLEVVSLAEHLRAIVSEARAAAPGPLRDRAARDLRNALRALGSAAHSFGEKAVARFAAEWSTRASTLDSHGLEVLDGLARLLADPTARASDVARELDRLAGSGSQAREPSRTPLRTPTGRELHAFLEDGIASFQELDEKPLSQPAALDDERIVPIEQLLYSGRAALERAAALRAELLDQHAAPPREAVEELFDLIELALAE
jgi:hypothetical protein